MRAFIEKFLGPTATTAPWDNPEPIRDELFRVERLDQHARSLAAAQPVTNRNVRGHTLSDRLTANAESLLAAYRGIIKAVDEGHAITPAAVWLMDNYHLVERQVRQVRFDLPPEYYRQLPKLSEGPFVGYPRVLGVVWAFVAHTDSRFAPDTLCRYVRAYQEVQPLTIGELWAVAITLRIVLIENLRRIAARIHISRASRADADDLADRLLGTGGRVAEPVPAVLADYEGKPLTDAFAVQLIHRLRDQDPKINPVLTWLDGRLAGQGTTADAVVHDEQQRQGTATVTVRNIITSMRLISDVDWTKLFERMSIVDDILVASTGFSGAGFAGMDFPTRNLYRSAIEELARGSTHTELEIARKAVAAAKSAGGSGDDVEDARRADPGYYLIAAGRPAFERTLGLRRSVRHLIAAGQRSIGVVGYVAAIAVVETLLLGFPIVNLLAWGLDRNLLILLAILGAIPAVDAAIAIVNWVVMRTVGPTLLPALDIREAVPAPLRTMVVVPTLLFSKDAVAEQIERLEIHHLASPAGDLHFALLTDWGDAETETRTSDDPLLAAAMAGIARLNRRYGPAPAGPRFLLLHRRRVFTQSERRWMGWERKRGKLHELNRLLRGATDTTFMPLNGIPPAAPPDIRYVITLDADTKLPRDTVRRLIGKMAHPLNRPRFDPAVGRVVEGYAIMQPRVTPSLPIGREGSLFQRIFSSISGIDPYASAVSDIYQDLFGEGSYTGKGIYDVDAFEAALADRVPESALLSHDLFEGIFARAGLASDVEVVDDFPARYDVAALRHHRWARGDWQLLPWIIGWGSASDRGGKSKADRARRAMPQIGRWKMLDNLRRTLSAPAAILALLAGWTLALPAAVIWTGFILSTLLLPPLIPLIDALGPRRPGISLRSHVRVFAADVRLALSLIALVITFLAHQATLMGDAILRTLGRLLISRRNMLEWVPAAQVAIGPALGLAAYYRRMFGAVVIGVLALATALGAGTQTWWLAAPLALLWAVSPAVARWSSLPQSSAGAPPISEGEAQALRLTARRTWRFFEEFVTPADHMLPPDNFQENPIPVVAHRTSPTNIGLYLLSIVSARDLGWIGTVEATERLEATLATMARLDRLHGHFYNWYDTGDLRPLEPRYISSVDSGNLAGHLIALANACREWRRHDLPSATRRSGLTDALVLTRAESVQLRGGLRAQTGTWRQLDEALTVLMRDATQNVGEADDLASRHADLAARVGEMADIARALAPASAGGPSTEMLIWADAAQRTAESHRLDLQLTPEAAAQLNARLVALERAARETARQMDFNFLFDQERKLLSIGFLPAQGLLDASCYDLLASEARLASFIAIAKGDIPAQHWFLLGRSVTPIGDGAALISWSGSMFEYLMPSLIMRAPNGSLIERTNTLIVRRQIEYAARLGVPWGISESAYNVRDREFTYQYLSFGIPGLGLKRGLEENTVIAPYATGLGVMVDPKAAVRNFDRLTAVGALGRYGFYEALDYTPERLPIDTEVAVVQAFMAHHQGMTIVAICNALLNGIMRTRFHAEPIIQAAELLLQERTPREVAVFRPWESETASAVKIREIETPVDRHFTSAHTPTPATHLLSNGRYAVMLTAAGAGYSRWHDMSITRWREDATCDDWGSFIFLRDVQSGDVWSAGFQPSGAEPDEYDVSFDEDHAEIVRRDGTLTTTTEVLVSTEYDAEVRRVTISNTGTHAREIDVTSYAELVLAPHAADLAHPAFSKLFIETSVVGSGGTIVATRRRRAPTDPEIWAAHLVVVVGEVVGKPEFETDRARFLGRGGDVRNPIAVIDGLPLSNTVGCVLDPIFALRRRVRVSPGAAVRVSFWTAAASSQANLTGFIDQRHDRPVFERTAMLAWTQARVQLHHLGIDPAEAALYQRLAAHLIYATSTFRPSSDAIKRGIGPQTRLWAHGISGDLPLVLLRISDSEHLDTVRQLLQAHEYWRMKQLAVDLVIVNERASSYVQDIQIALESLVRTSQARSSVEGAKFGRVFVLRADLMTAEARGLLAAVARAVFAAQGGRLSEQFKRMPRRKLAPPPRGNTVDAGTHKREAPAVPRLEFFNGVGGFGDQGREYVTVLGPGQSTPGPWLNVIANPAFGFQVTAEGAGYTWAVNSRENQLTPWSNDPVADPSGETFYLRDEDSGKTWSPTARPIRDPAGTYVCRHGRGYSRFEYVGHGIASDLLQFVPMDEPIKISRLTLRNTSERTRRIAVTAYVEWVLGRSRTGSAPFTVTELDSETGALFARNSWSAAFGSRVAFADLAGRQTDWTCDRREFIGRNGTVAAPIAVVAGGRLSNTAGAGLDPCSALRAVIVLAPGATAEIDLFLGQGASTEEARQLVQRYRAVDLDSVLAEVNRHWTDVLSVVEVTTPDRSMDIMLNGWLMYQSLVCRIWARSGFYQSSGAYGFRDQLQDGMSLLWARPDLSRAHLLRAAGRQFVEGDLQHWWLPHSGQGVRTRMSDDRPWLAYAVAHYVGVTGDASVLDEMVPFLEGPRLASGEHDQFFEPTLSDENATVYAHCALALDESLAVGERGLPLIGTGDWNDGMNRVGELGKGESVWLAWFLHAALTAFAPLADARNEAARAARWRAHATALESAIEKNAWDGAWYRRGYFDDGTPLGSATSDECKIDSIAQSWGVISGAADPTRAALAMTAADRELTRAKDGLVLLFTPPFDKTPLDPGYIKGYPPGIRENGGQYTHAALWSVMAWAKLGAGDKAGAMFSLLNPINHARSRADAFRYRVEPYVVAADVYSTPPHVGRGGWTWYTGSAGWMQRAGIESILGVQIKAGFLQIEPCIPKAWPGFQVKLRYRTAVYEIRVENPEHVERGIVSADSDGLKVASTPMRVRLADDGTVHRVVVRLGAIDNRRGAN